MAFIEGVALGEHVKPALARCNGRMVRSGGNASGRGRPGISNAGHSRPGVTVARLPVGAPSAATAGLRLPAEPAAGKVTQVRKERPRPGRRAASQRRADAVRLPVLAAPGPAREGCVDAAAGAAGVQARLSQVPPLVPAFEIRDHGSQLGPQNLKGTGNLLSRLRRLRGALMLEFGGYCWYLPH